MGESFQPKLIYLARRKAGLSRAAFTKRWREHGRLGMSMPRWCNIARYVHCDVLEPRAEERHLLDDCDGIGMIWHKSPEHREAHIADQSSWAIMQTDEAETFERPILKTCLVSREALVAPRCAHATLKLVRFVLHGSVGESPSESCGHLVNYPLTPETGARWGLNCQLVEEFWFHTREGAVAAAAQLALQGKARFALSNEVLLYSSASAPSGRTAVHG